MSLASQESTVSLQGTGNLDVDGVLWGTLEMGECAEVILDLQDDFSLFIDELVLQVPH